jgi:glucose-1-phosphate thymidylyltransferase|tara:strand:- start:3492 stop:4508 length:1017 start_codon:yes stop_codon:yes gene_type:complete
MKIIIPMAGRGSRLRPQTLTTPKPLVSIAGTPILEQLVRDTVQLIDEAIDEIVFIIGDPLFFDKQVEEDLKALAKKYNAKALIYRQLNPLGTGHAIMCAKNSLKGRAIVIYPDTLIKVKEKFDKNSDVVIWTKQVDNPDSYGVVKLNSNNEIIDLVEKPLKFVSDLAVIGIYYFKEISQLRDKLEIFIANNKMNSGEYQINDGLLAMMKEGRKFSVGKVSDWLDCGNVKKCVIANKTMLTFLEEDGTQLISKKINLVNSKIIPPCSIAKGVTIKNSSVGPHVSIGLDSEILNSTISNSIIQSNSKIRNAKIKKSMIGNNCIYDGKGEEINIGDFSELI